MKETFFPHHFFDLLRTNFKQLFTADKPVWEALKKIEPFLNDFDFSQSSKPINTNHSLIHPELIFFGKGCKIGPYATIEGPCYIGPGVEIGPHAFIRPFSILEEEVKVGHCSEVKHSLLLRGAKLPHFNYVGDSILGVNVNLGAGVVCANYKINKKEVFVKNGSSILETGLKKFGAVIGDDSFLGCNSVTNPGALLKKGFSCLPCSNIKGVHL